jgi:hypothetical protein
MLHIKILSLLQQDHLEEGQTLYAETKLLKKMEECMSF